jgi:CDP-glycerol glycerophosphotransferase
VGYPRNDVLATATGDRVERARGELGIEPGLTAVLYAPTHRDHQAGFVAVLDLAEVADALGPDYVVLARTHYFHGADPALRRLHGEGRIRDVSDHPSVEELCLAADVLITDYSSIMFDYAVLDRPIVLHAPDWELYRVIRGTYFDLLAEGPGVVTRTEAEVIEAFRSGVVWGEPARRARTAFRSRFCELEDGHAAERVVRRVFLGEPEAGAPARRVVATAKPGTPPIQ